MPEFNRGHGQIDSAGMDATRATARLPGVTCQPWLVAARALALPWTLALPAVERRRRITFRAGARLVGLADHVLGA
jgi:hypothetical protein